MPSKELRRDWKALAQNDATILGTEIDWLRGYGWDAQTIAAHLGCSMAVIAKWVKTHPAPADPWGVRA